MKTPIKLTVLGSGTALQFQNRGSSSYLIENKECKILLDCGFFLLDRLEKINVKIDQIDYIFISHKHPDHFMGLIHFLFAMKNSFYKRDNPLVIFGFKGLKDYLSEFKKVLGHWIEPLVEIKIVEEEQPTFPEFYAKLFKTEHSDESCGIKLFFEKYIIAYTGDTDYFPQLKEELKDANFLLTECGSGVKNKLKGHLSIEDILKLTSGINISNVVISHLYPESYNDIIQTKVPENFTIAKDLMSIEIFN